MGKQFSALPEAQIEFIGRQHIFFVGTADKDGRVNVSPKGADSLRVLDPNRIIWLNLTGSGNETAGHLSAFDRITLMWCSFEGSPLILRAYGRGSVLHPRDLEWPAFSKLFGQLPPGARQIVDVRIDLVQTSCGFAVPLFEYKGDRTLLNEWAEKKGNEGIAQYWAEKNQRTIDGKPTHIFGH